MDGFPRQVEHVQAPRVILKGLHGVGEVARQVGDAYLVAIHSHVRHEVGRKPVGEPCHATLLFPGKVFVDDIVAPVPVKREEGGHGILVSAGVGCHGHDVGAERHGSAHLSRELPFAAMPAGTPGLHRHVVHDRGRDRKRDVHHLARGADARGAHLQRLPTFRTSAGRVPPPGSGDTGQDQHLKKSEKSGVRGFIFFRVWCLENLLYLCTSIFFSINELIIKLV